MRKITITVNGVRRELDVEPRQLLVYTLREQLGLTGTNIGCDTTSCGACTVHLDGRAVKSIKVGPGVTAITIGSGLVWVSTVQPGHAHIGGF